MKKFLSVLIALFITQSAFAVGISNPPSSGGGSATAPGGSSGQIQYNNGGSFGGTTIIPLANGGTNAATAQGALVTLLGAPPLYVTNFGAKCDGKKVAGISISSGSATPSGYTFSAADAGKYITIAGAGASSTVPLNTTISSVVGGVATLAATAATTVSGANARFGTNDASAFANAVSAGTAQGSAVVYLPNGRCVVASSTTVPTEISFAGLGWGKSIVDWISTSDMTDGVFSGANNGVSAVSCTASVAANQVDNQFSNFEIDVSAATANSGYNVSAKGIKLQCNVRSVIDHMYVHDTPATGIATDYSFPGWVTNSEVDNPGRLCGTGSGGGVGGNGIGEGLAAGGGDTYIVTGDVVVNPAHYGIFWESQQNSGTAQSYATANNDIVFGGSASGANQSGTSAAGIANSGSMHLIMNGDQVYGTGNTSALWNGVNIDQGTLPSSFNNSAGVGTEINGLIVANAGIGVQVNYTIKAPSGSLAAHIMINGADIENNATQGVALNPNGSVAMDGISIVNSFIAGNGWTGIGSFNSGGNAGITNLTLSNDTFANNGGRTPPSAYRQSAVSFNANVSGLIMTANRCYDNATGAQKYCLSNNTGTTISNAAVTNNNFTGIGTSAFDILGTLSGQVRDNLGEPTFTLSGACASTTPVGSGTGGKFTSGTAGSCVTTILPFGTANIIAANGYACSASDITTATDIITQTASSTTGCTLTGPTNSADVIVFNARQF